MELITILSVRLVGAREITLPTLVSVARAQRHVVAVMKEVQGHSRARASAAHVTLVSAAARVAAAIATVLVAASEALIVAASEALIVAASEALVAVASVVVLAVALAVAVAVVVSEVDLAVVLVVADKNSKYSDKLVFRNNTHKI